MVRHSLRYGNLVLERYDFLMVKKYMQGPLGLEDYTHENALALLEENLLDAIVVYEKNMPSEVVRLYSTVSVISSSGMEECFQLVPPDQVDLAKGRKSALSNLGCSVLGLSQGDIIRYGVPSDFVSLRLAKVEQVDTKTRLAISEKELRTLFKRNLMEKMFDELELESS
ncbi:MAG: GreA/GreB family elongation factor [Muricauda sp.]|nr:GreA/GreB family elongation factor [Allomuricauda sp.]MBA4743737.1 GreA/GreB family elongation factor [Allomuricauda sp.]